MSPPRKGTEKWGLREAEGGLTLFCFALQSERAGEQFIAGLGGDPRGARSSKLAQALSLPQRLPGRGGLNRTPRQATQREPLRRLQPWAPVSMSQCHNVMVTAVQEDRERKLKAKGDIDGDTTGEGVWTGALR